MNDDIKDQDFDLCHCPDCRPELWKHKREEDYSDNIKNTSLEGKE